MHRTLLAGAAIGASAIAAAIPCAAVAGAAASHSGKITYESVEGSTGKASDVVTGIINDYGTDKPAGKNAQKIILSKGTFTVDSTRFNKSVKVKVDKKDCVYIGHGSAANLPISKGTGAYAGITGTITVQARFTFFGTVSGGKCNFNHPAAGVESFSGTGHVSY